MSIPTGDGFLFSGLVSKLVETYTDAELFEHIVAGDRDAFTVFYRRHASKLYGLAFKLLGEPQLAADALQDVFLQLWKRRHDYSEKRGQPLVWLSVMCRHRCIDILRSQNAFIKRTAQLTDATMSWSRDRDAENPLDDAHLAHLKDLFAAAFTKLPEEQRTILRLAYEKGLSATEIAKKFGLPVGTVKSRVRLGMDKLRQVLATKKN
jgi:RNA polymerase sigma-70 factor (ECF subfamily)